jgi:hypothetical protein
MKKIVASLIIILTLSYLFYSLSFVAPKINLNCEIKTPDLTISRSFKLSKENSKDITVKLRIKTPSVMINDLSINMDSLTNTLINKNHFFEINSSDYTNKGKMEYDQRLIVYLNNTSETQFLETLKQYKVKVS